MSVLVHWHVSCVVARRCIVSLEPWLPLVYCQKQSHPPHTWIHLSPPRKQACAYALVYDSQTNPSHRKHVLHMHVRVCTCSHVLVYAYLRLLFQIHVYMHGVLPVCKTRCIPSSVSLCACSTAVIRTVTTALRVREKEVCFKRDKEGERGICVNISVQLTTHIFACGHLIQYL